MNDRFLSITAWILRVGVAMTFLGHGAFALLGRPRWLGYLATVGIDGEAAPTVLTLIGLLDVTVAAFVLFYPHRVVVGWAVCWTLATALIRPLSGEPWWEFVERGANWAAPLALLWVQTHQATSKRKVKDVPSA